MSVHNVLAQLSAATRSGQVADSLSMSGLDSLLIDASVVDVSATTMTVSATNAYYKGGTIAQLVGGATAVTGTTINIVATTSVDLSGGSVVIGGALDKLGFNGATPVVQQSALTTPTSAASALLVNVQEIAAILSNFGLTA
jgi:hypothetical protein